MGETPPAAPLPADGAEPAPALPRVEAAGRGAASWRPRSSGISYTLPEGLPWTGSLPGSWASAAAGANEAAPHSALSKVIAVRMRSQW
jgi:hypothetical protein